MIAPAIALRPSVTVIMPVFNEAKFIRDSLGAVLAQDYPEELIEIIIADGMSTDDTRSIVNELASNAGRRILIVDNTQKIAATGLNVAFQHSTSDVIARVDGHCIVPHDYISKCVDALTDPSISAVGGIVETIGSSETAKAIALAMSSKFGVGGSAFRVGVSKPSVVDTVPFAVYRRETMLRLGPYEERLVRNQDDEYNYRIRHDGGKILLLPSLKTVYVSRASNRKLWSQYFQYGYWKVIVLRRHPFQLKIRQLVPSALVVALLGGAILSLPDSPLSTPARSILALYPLSLFVAALLTAGLRLVTVTRLVFAFAILHLAYGSGFLYGLVVHVSGRHQYQRKAKINQAFS